MVNETQNTLKTLVGSGRNISNRKKFIRIWQKKAEIAI